MSFTAEPLEASDAEQMKKLLPVINFTVRYNPGNFLLSPEYENVLRDIINLDVYQDDVWVCSYLRTGSNWCQEIVWLIINNLAFDTAKTKAQMYRSPLITTSGFVFDIYNGNSVEYVRNMKRPRCIKSHEPYGLLPKQMEIVKPKMIYCIRNPKDVFCSYYVFFKTFMKLTATFEEAGELFCKGKMCFGDYIDHCLSYWNKRHEPNILILFYEDMSADPKKTITDISNFLDRPLAQEQIDKINDFVKFNNMKHNPGTNLDALVGKIQFLEFAEGKHVEAFMRKGQSGGWKEEMSLKLSEMFDEWIYRKTKGSGLSFKF